MNTDTGAHAIRIAAAAQEAVKHLPKFTLGAGDIHHQSPSSPSPNVNMLPCPVVQCAATQWRTAAGDQVNPVA
jgi:hypothetical protein